MAYLKPQSPLQDKKSGDYFYPLTTIDQVIAEDGNRLNNELSKYLTVDINDANEGEANNVNADTLGGYLPEHYATTEMVNSITPENIGAMSMELLWQNASPTSEFAATTISLDLSEYDFIIIETGHGTGFFRIGAAIQLCAMVDFKMCRRIFIANETSIECTAALNESDTTVNNVAVPSNIYGVKGVF